MTRRRWTDEEDAALRELVASGLEYKRIGKRLDRSVNACRSRAAYLGVKQEWSATLANRKCGNDRFYRNKAKVERRRKKTLKTYTADERAVRAAEARHRNLVGTLGMRGRHHSPETRARISAAHKGRKMAEATKRKISEARKRYWFIRKGGAQIKTKKAAMNPYDASRAARDDYKQHRPEMEAEEQLFWCDQCDRRVTAEKIAACVSRFCKAKRQVAA